MAAATFESISTDIRNRKFAPVYFFCGEEPYYIDVLTDLIEQHALNDMEKAFNQTIVYGKDLTARQIMETAGRLPMMAERQVLIIREAQALSLKEDEEAQYLAYIKNPVKTTLLVFAWKHGKPDGRKAFGKELVKASVYFESKALKDYQLTAWIKTWIRDRKYKIDERAANLLAEYIGTNLQNINNELEKLIINKKPDAAITLDDIEAQVGVSKDYNPFELQAALGVKDRTKAFKIANYFGANPKSGPVVMVVAILQTYFNKVYLCHQFKAMSDNELGGIIKVGPYYVKDYKLAAQNYSLQKLEKIFYLLEEYDLRSKGVNNVSVKDGELMKEMVFRILQ